MTSPILIRAAIGSEREALERLQTRASLNNPRDRAAILANPEGIDLPATQIEAGRVFIAEQGRSILGFAVVLPRDDGDADLDGLFVEPNRWRHGIGRRLVEHCAAVARSEGAALLHVVGNPHAEAFYLACGFTHAGAIETRFGVGFLLRKQL